MCIIYNMHDKRCRHLVERTPDYCQGNCKAKWRDVYTTKVKCKQPSCLELQTHYPGEDDDAASSDEEVDSGVEFGMGTPGSSA